MNILFTCAGRRNYLLDYFRTALDNKGLILAADGSHYAPALQAADKSFILPYVDSEDYILSLIELCKKENVAAVISLNDLELPVLSNNIQLFKENNIDVLVSSKDVIDICFDKWETHKFLEKNGIDSPKTYHSLNTAIDAINKKEIMFPLVLKPRWGTGSIGIEYIEDQRELELSYELAQKKILKTILSSISSTDLKHSIIIQELLGGDEFGLDIINDLDSQYQTTIVKKKLAMRAGETDKAIVLDKPELVDLGAKISSTLKHRINLDCDVFQVKGKNYVLEMNPRFGGGYPFSYMAGVDLPKAIINWLNKSTSPITILSPKYNVMSAKYDQLTVIKKESKN